MNLIIKYRTLLLISAGLFVLISSCKGWDEDDIHSTFDEAKNPETSFTISASTIEAGNYITFTNTSTNSPTLFTWNFPGGSPSYSNEENPTILYDVKGEFDVEFTSRNEFGANTIISEKLITVEGRPIPWVANYTFDNSLDDIGLNGINATSTYGTPEFDSDRNGAANSSWHAPFVAGEHLSIPGYKGIGGDAKRSVSVWFKLPAGTTRHTIVSWGLNSGGKMFNVMLDKDRIRVEAGACSLKSTKTGLADDNWHHLAITYDPADGPKLADVKIYIDGVLNPNAPDGAGNSYRSTVVDINTDISTTDVMIGQALYRSSYLWNGSLDDLRILDDVLVPAQVQSIYEGLE